MCIIAQFALSDQPNISVVFKARLAQSVERKALNLVVVGSSPTVGVFYLAEHHIGTCTCTYVIRMYGTV